MRCAMGHLAGVVMTIGIVSCSQSDSDFKEGGGDDRSFSPDDVVAFHGSDDGDDGSDYASTTVRERPVETRREDARIRTEPERSAAPQGQQWKPDTPLKAGTLTAGSIDDHARYSAFRDYLSNTLQRSPNHPFAAMKIGRRVVIRVSNLQGEGVGDARVTVRPIPSDNQRADDVVREFKTTTSSDGRALFLSARDLPAVGCDYQLTVQPVGDGKPVTQRVTLDQPAWNVVLSDRQRHLPVKLDLALVIDTTGSMQDELDYLKVEIDDIAAAVKRRFPNVEQRFALILYRDDGDDYVTRTFDFTGSLTEFRRRLAEQSASGGGDYPEAMHLALEQAGQLSWQKANTARVLFLVGDAPPHSRFAERTSTAVESLRDANVKLFPVAGSGVRDEAEWVMRSAAFLTMGRYLFLTDHSGVGKPHAKPQTPSYSVERLNALMVRMIASELAGRELLPGEIIGTEASSGVIVPLQNRPTTRPPNVSTSPNPTVATTCRTSHAIAGWLYEVIRRRTTFFIVAMFAVVLIWKLDTRRRSSVV